MGRGRWILHVDMDAFFAAIEQRDQPRFRGKPVIVGALPGHRGVVSTCSYEARAFGIHSAMPIREAYERCPQGIYLSGSFGKYSYVSSQVMEIIRRFTPNVEPVSVDEAYMDISGHSYTREEDLARDLKGRIQKTLRLTCSIGIASTRVFAKLATNMKKPDGLTVIRDEEIPDKVYPQPVMNLYGIGEKSERILVDELNIRTIGDLAGASERRLKVRFGIYGETLIRKARGEGSDTVHKEEETPEKKSIGHEHTFGDDTRDLRLIEGVLLALSQKVARRVRRAGHGGYTLVLKIRYHDFSTITRQQKNRFLLWEDQIIYQEALRIFHTQYKPARFIRLLGISVKDLIPVGSHDDSQQNQLELFDPLEKNERLHAAIDTLKNTYGEGIVDRGLSIHQHYHSF